MPLALQLSGAFLIGKELRTSRARYTTARSGQKKGGCNEICVDPECELIAYSVSLKGKKVAVIGTGATGIQLSQEVGKMADSTTVFQRTPNLCLPMGQRKLTKEEQDKDKVNCECIDELKHSSLPRPIIPH